MVRNILILLSLNGSCTDPFYITLLTRQKIVPNVTHGHLQGDNTKRVEVETKRRESMRKRWRGNAHEKKEDSFVVLFLLPIFQFEGHTLIRWYRSWNYKVFAFHSLVSFHHSLLRYQPLQHYLHHLYLPSLFGIPVHILTKTYIQQAKVHFKYFIPTIRYGIMVNNNTLCFKKMFNAVI